MAFILLILSIPLFSMRPIAIIISLLSALLFVLLTACGTEEGHYTRGEEVFPPRNLTQVVLWQPDGVGVGPAFFADRWTLVVLESSDCAEACRRRLELIDSIEDVQKLFVADGVANHDKLRALSGDYADMTVAMGTTAFSFDIFRRQLLDSDWNDLKHDGSIFVVSPEGAVVLKYPGNGERQGLQRELERLEK
jgi:cytochrome oxidase Cu insertion factor (SCO1/SenC/PrrC family)